MRTWKWLGALAAVLGFPVLCSKSTKFRESLNADIR